jgi:hypothetical protein
MPLIVFTRKFHILSYLDPWVSAHITSEERVANLL